MRVAARICSVKFVRTQKHSAISKLAPRPKMPNNRKIFMGDKSSSVSIEPLSGSLVDRRRFVRFQFDLYRNDPMWIPPLIVDELNSLSLKTNPGLENCELQLWLAIRGGQCVGRVAGVINHRDNKFRGVKAARFCLLDFIDDHEVARALLETVEAWAIDQEMNVLEGPLGLTTFERSAVLIEGFDHLPTVVSSYNFPYYAKHLESCGFAKHIDYLEHHFQIPAELTPKYQKVADYVLKKKGLRKVEHLSRKNLRPLGREIFQLINDAYSGLYEFTPMSNQEVDALIGKFLSFIDPRFIKLIVNESDTIVAVGIAMPSHSTLLQKINGQRWRILPALVWDRLTVRKDTLDLYLVAVSPGLRNSGLTAILMQMMHQSALNAGIKRIETNGELETNIRVLAMWKDIDHETHKRRRIYSKKLAPS